MLCTDFPVRLCSETVSVRQVPSSSCRIVIKAGQACQVHLCILLPFLSLNLHYDCFISHPHHHQPLSALNPPPFVFLILVNSGILPRLASLPIKLDQRPIDFCVVQVRDSGTCTSLTNREPLSTTSHHARKSQLICARALSLVSLFVFGARHPLHRPLGVLSAVPDSQLPVFCLECEKVDGRPFNGKQPY